MSSRTPPEQSAQEDGLSYLPIFLDLRARLCLVLGGEASVTKVRLLRRARARVRVLADDLCDDLRRLADADDIEWRKPSVSVDLEGVALLVDTTPGAGWTEPWLAVARARGIPINTVDRRDACDFIFPAILDRSPVIVAISTGGAAPALARLLRQKLETAIPPGIARLARLCGQWRDRVRAFLPGARARQRFWDEVLEGPIAKEILAGRTEYAEAAFERALVHRQRQPDAKPGSVELVGAGPGAADLLTLRAAEAIRKADVILYDRLAGKEILQLARREARLVEVGKRAGSHSTAQKDINEQLLAFARAGLRVVRLKGGDPLVFGRGGEEAIFLRRHGIAVQIVPGVTAALGCAASLGLPLTYRGLARKIVFLTGHSCDGELDLDWAALADPAATLAIYMGRANAARFSRELIEAGLPPSTPAVAIENGTWSNERHWFTNLRALPDAVAESASEWPLLVLIGRTVSLAQMSPQLEAAETEVAAA